jgi:hypothetical protein
MQRVSIDRSEDFGMTDSKRGPSEPSRKGSNDMRSPQGQVDSAKDKSDSLDPRIQNEIGKHLRAIYDDVINEPLPDRFMELLEKLERSSRKN